MQQIGWHYLQCQIPDDWECTNYNNEPRQGRLQFNTRDGIQATFNWRIFKHPIDEIRMINEVHKRHLKDHAPELALKFMELQQERVGDYILAYDTPGQIAHASHFVSEHRIHTHWIFSNYSQEQKEQVIRPILESCATNHDAQRRWALYGMNGFLPNTYRPIEIEAVPANVSLIFEGPKHHHIYLRRFGIPEILMNGNTLFGFYGNYQKKLRRRVTAKRGIEVMGMPGVELHVEQRGEYSMDKLAGRWWRGTASIWHNVEEKRLYCLEQIGPKKAKTLEFDDVIRT